MAKRTSTEILGAILETLDEIYLNQQKSMNPEEDKKDSGKGKKKDSSKSDKDMDLNTSFDVLENMKLDKQKASDLSVFVSSLKALSTIDNKKLEKNINSAVKMIDALGKIKIDGPKLNASIAALGPVMTGLASIASVSVFKLWTAMRFLTKKNATRIGEFIKAIIDSLKGIKVTKDLEPLTTFTKGIAEILLLFTDKTKDFNPITGYFRGKQIALYFKAITGSLSKMIKMLVKVLEPIKKEMVNAMKQLESFVATMLSIRFRDVIVLNLSLKILNTKNAENFVSFVKVMLKAVPEKSDKIDNLNKLFVTLSTLRLRDIIKLNISFRLLNTENAENFANFVKIILKAIPRKDTKIDSLSKLFKAMSGLKIITVLTMWLAGHMLSEKLGENINKFINSLINKLPSEKKIDQFRKVLKSITTSMLIMVGLLVVLTVIAHWDWKALLIGLGAVAGVMLLLVGFLYLLSFDKMQKALKSAGKNLLLISASVLLMVIAVGLILYMSTFSEKINWLGVLGIFVGLLAMVGIMWLLTKAVKEHGKDLLMGVLAIILLLGGVAFITYKLIIPIGEKAKDALWGALLIVGLILVMGLMVYAATWWIEKLNKEDKIKYVVEAFVFMLAIAALLWVMGKAMVPFMDLLVQIKDLDAADVAAKSAVIVGVIAAMAGLVVALGYAVKMISLKNMALGAVFLGAIAGLIWLLSKAMNPYVELMEQLKDLSWKDLGNGSAKVLVVLTGFGLLVTGLGALTMIPGFVPLLAAGAFILGLISGIIYGVAKAVGEFVDLINKTNELSPKVIDGFIGALVGDDRRPGLVAAIRKTIFALSGIGFWAAIKARFISRMITPIFTAVGKFVDILVQMASGQYVKEYDKNGNPVYGLITKEMYNDAAEAIADGFSLFIEKLSVSFEKLSDSALRAMNKMRKSIGPLMEGVGSFANALVAMGSGTYTDADGKVQRITGEDYRNAADILTNSFVIFIKQFNESFSKKELKQAGKKMKKLLKGDLGAFIDAIKSLSESLVNVCKIVSESNIDVISMAKLTGQSVSALLNSFDIKFEGHIIEASLKKGNSIVQESKKIMEELLNSFTSSKITMYRDAV